MDTPFEQVNKIFSRLQEGLWSDHTVDLLLSAQGKLATLLPNIYAMQAEADKNADLAELFAKQVEASLYLACRADPKRTGELCKFEARFKSNEEYKNFIELESKAKELRYVTEAMVQMINACSRSLRNLEQDFKMTNKQN